MDKIRNVIELIKTSKTANFSLFTHSDRLQSHKIPHASTINYLRSFHPIIYYKNCGEMALRCFLFWPFFTLFGSVTEAHSFPREREKLLFRLNGTVVDSFREGKSFIGTDRNYHWRFGGRTTLT